MDVTQVDDWAEIEGSFSRQEFLRWNPNDALIYYVLEYYLRQRKCRLVSIGLSSVESTGKEAGLHAFKRKVGFTAEPVPIGRSCFHPLLRPLANSLTLACMRGAMRVFPRYRPLRKAEGVLAAMLGNARASSSHNTKHTSLHAKQRSPCLSPQHLCSIRCRSGNACSCWIHQRGYCITRRSWWVVILPD